MAYLLAFPTGMQGRGGLEVETLAPLGETVQATVTLREAAVLLGVSERRIRRMVTAGQLRATKARGAHGPEYRIEQAALPATLPVAQRAGRVQATHGAGQAEATVLAGLLRDTQSRLDGALVRLGAMQEQASQVALLEERAASLVQGEATARAEAERARGEREAEARARTAAEGEAAAARRAVTWWRTASIGAAIVAIGLAAARVFWR